MALFSFSRSTYPPVCRAWMLTLAPSPVDSRRSSAKGSITRLEADGLLSSNRNYGTYQVLGNLTIDFDAFSQYTNYRRSPNLSTEVYTTSFELGGYEINTTAFCSYPDQVSVWYAFSTRTLPPLNVHLQNLLVAQNLVNVTCEDNLHVRSQGVTRLRPPEILKYEAVVRVSYSTISSTTTSCSNSELKVTSAEVAGIITVVVGAGSSFDQTKGNSAAGYSFKGVDATSEVNKAVSEAAKKASQALLDRHIRDFSAIEGKSPTALC
jgi:alpha-L-fucosidase 2